MKIYITLAVLIATTLAEPPVDNRYLPPQRGLSQSYGAPGFGQRQTDAVFRAPNNRNTLSQYRAPSPQYGAPLNQPSNQYLPSLAQPSNQYAAPNSAQLSRQYGLPNAQPSSQYGVPNAAQRSNFGARNSAQPSSQYGAPSAAPSSQYLPSLAQPSSQYGAPQQSQARLSQQYGAPGQGISGEYQNGLSSFRAPEQSRQYLPPGAGSRGYDDGSNGEPANYNFEYMVKDEPSGNDFGHRESRQGDRAEGLYYVLLPDGRKQTVEYEADQDGYRPRISYEDTGAGLNGYGRNQAYNQGGPY